LAIKTWQKGGFFIIFDKIGSIRRVIK
jgi:hypothetical protein